jgi:hypothetical protein
MHLRRALGHSGDRQETWAQRLVIALTALPETSLLADVGCDPSNSLLVKQFPCATDGASVARTWREDR